MHMKGHMRNKIIMLDVRLDITINKEGFHRVASKEIIILPPSDRSWTILQN